MKRAFTITLITLVLIFMSSSTFAQQPELQYFKDPGKAGINEFETSKETSVQFTDLTVRIGGASTLQWQGLSHSNSSAGDAALIELGSNFNLATANLDIDVQLADGLRMHLRTYLSSRHHHEPYVKGGYFQVDKLDFISPGFMEDIMEIVTIKVGHMENNYGDAHFRRSDNAMTSHNPFVGNLIMDSFTTEVGGEVYVKKNNLLGMIGLSNGKLNQSPTDPGETGVAIQAKAGVDKQVNNDLRVRLTGSLYTIGKAARIYLYSADRAGARFYNVMENTGRSGSDDFRSGRWNPGFSDKLTAIMVNPFVKFQGVELFGTYEMAKDDNITWNQIAGEAIYRFGSTEQFYAGARFNNASGDQGPIEVSISRIEAAFGWFLTNNVGAKLEYVQQNYNDFPAGDRFFEGEFSGIIAEAMISF